MVKIEKTDIENIKILEKELKSKNLSSVKIKKGDYEIEISSKENISHKTENIQTTENPYHLSCL